MAQFKRKGLELYLEQTENTKSKLKTVILIIMKSKLNQIKELLNIQVKLEEMKLENGTIVTADSFEKDSELFIVTDDQQVAMPVGEYILEDGRLLVVSEEGIIADIRDVADDVTPKEGEEVTEDLEDENHEGEPEDEKKEDEKELEEEADVADWKGMEKRIQNLEDAIADLKGDKESKMEEVPEEPKVGEEVNVLKSRTVKEEFSEVLEPAVSSIKANPESESVQKKKVEFVHNKMGATTMDRILHRLTNK
tara:strand:- start:5427 stop:6179 length:753 start_codon:yes stop_codon:yes gene_type:complete